MTDLNFTIELPPSFDFNYLLRTYVIYPWIVQDDALIRPLRFGVKDATLMAVRVEQRDANRLSVVAYTDDSTAHVGVREVRTELMRCLCLEDRSQAALAELAKGDEVLSAALQTRGEGGGKRYPDLFEALCGVVCARRTNFSRIYQMMRQIAYRFGSPMPFPFVAEFAFPQPSDLSSVEPSSVRECGVGFRANTLAEVAQSLTAEGYSWHDWRNYESVNVIERLAQIKGVGPYTANLAVTLSYGHCSNPHVDSYVRRVIGTCYLNDPSASDSDVRTFMGHTWGDMAETVLDLLTTDTERWAAKLGIDVGVRSGARNAKGG